MKILLITGPLWPRLGNNANLFGKIVPFLSRQHEVQILSAIDSTTSQNCPSTVFDVPVKWHPIVNARNSTKLVAGLRSRLTDHAGSLGYAGGAELAKTALEYRTSFPFELVISTMQPYYAACAAAILKGVPKILYLMDPPDFAIPGELENSIQKMLPWALRKQDVILTTPFILEKLNSVSSLSSIPKKAVQFPLIHQQTIIPAGDDIQMDPNKINLLYCGALFPEIRDPSCLLKIISFLDDRFAVHFMGRGCTKFWEKYKVETKAKVSAYEPRSYQAACNAMEHADFLINLGNNMRVHMPSKTLEYINSGKPIIHFYKFADCPTLKYMTAYPLALFLPEYQFEPRYDSQRVISFCLAKKGFRVSRKFIEDHYWDCTPPVIAEAVQAEIMTLLH